MFILGDVLGTGIYVLTGKVIGEEAGAAWLPFVVAFALAAVAVAAGSYLDLVTKYPKAAGAASYMSRM